ncbi:MFS transporter [Amycolatopsis jejuensis]|uniref:MFS transporter n=1 Tax=Amycolatopsis jejuensis TaxID=330084 RepID=UPI00068EF484|nr:MFS transporter [Amycolatopsis jejuensis]
METRIEDARTGIVVKRRRALLAAFSGTTLEWYDFFLYGSMAILVFPRVFFPGADGFAGVLLSVSTFGAAFVIRPLGAVLFGAMGDRRGRKHTLVVTVVLMGLATALIGVLPGYAQIGVWAPLALVVLRLLQGLSTGGEWGGAALMAVENAQASRKGRYGSVVQAASPAGLVLSNLVILGLSQLAPTAFLSWGWRIGFLTGGLIAVVGLLIRLGVAETPEFERLADRVAASPVRTVLRSHLGSLFRAAAIYLGPGGAFYAAIIFGQKYGVGPGRLTAAQMSLVVVVFGVAMLVATLLIGLAADRFGPARMTLAAIVALCVVTPCVLAVLASGNLALVIAVYVLMALNLAAVTAPMVVLFADLFPAEVRYSGVSMGYQLGTVVGGALPPIIALWLLQSTGTIWSVTGYLVGCLVISALCTAGLLARR